MVSIVVLILLICGLTHYAIIGILTGFITSMLCSIIVVCLRLFPENPLQQSLSMKKILFGNAELSDYIGTIITYFCGSIISSFGSLTKIPLLYWVLFMIVFGICIM